MRHSTIISLALILFVLNPIISVFIFDASSIDDATEDIIFEGNGSFTGSSSSYVRYGSGTESDPYVVSDHNMSGHNIQIKNTTSYVIVRNITISSSQRWGIFLYNADNVKIINVSSSGRGPFLYSSNCNKILVTECNVTNIPFTTNIIEVTNGNYITIQDSTFTVKGVTGSGEIFINNQGQEHKFIRNHLKGIDYTDQRIYSNGEISNNTMYDSTVTIWGGAEGARIHDNHFENSNGNTLQISTSYHLSILRNFFRATNGDGIAFTNIAYTATTKIQEIANNTFESCNRGISTQSTVQTRLVRQYIHHNYFGNCSGYAVELNNAFLCRTWRNIFYHNAGTDNTTAGSQVQEVSYPQSQWKNIFTVGGVGNFWANHRTPDNNNDGIVDVNYTIITNGLDTAPFTNPYFDRTRPHVELLSPVSKYSGRSYINARWDVFDIDSGIDKVLLKVDAKPYIDVTGKPSHSIFLEKGSHDITVRAMDRAGLFNESRNSVLINSTTPVVIIDAPVQGQYYNNPVQTIEWTVKEYFDLINLTITIDENEIHLPVGQRFITRNFEEGPHRLLIKVRDSDGFEYTQSLDIVIDLTPPEIQIISPIPGSVLSNPFISFNYLVSDNYGIEKMEINLNGGGWLDKTGIKSFNELLEQGHNYLYFRAEDLAGSVTNMTVNFTIGGETGINISSPINGTVTKESSVDLIWDYDGDFIWNSSLLRVGRAGIFEDIFGAKSWKIDLPSDGEYEITLRLEDDYGNFIQETVVVVKDIRPPNLNFVFPRDGSVLNYNDIDLEWLGIDSSGLPIVSYMIRIDDGQWTDLGLSTVLNIDLSDGEHRISVRGRDVAGNEGERSINVLVDTVDPEVSFIYPLDGELIQDPVVDFQWDVFDNNEYTELSLTIDGEISYDILTLTSGMKSVNMGKDGYHNATLFVRDIAGNTMNETIDMLVDTQNPAVNWRIEPSGYWNKEWFNLSWTIDEEWGISNITLLKDEVEIYLDTDAQWINLSLKEGSYDLKLKVIDIVGRVGESGIMPSLVIDLTPPTLQINKEKTLIEGKKAIIVWDSSDQLSGLGTFLISNDGLPFLDIGGDSNKYTYEELDYGEHNITLISIDKAGNSVTESWSFEIVDDRNGGQDGSDEGLPIFAWIAIVVVGLLLIFIVIGVIFNRNRSKQDQNITKMRKPDKIQVGPGNVPAPAALPMDAPGDQNLPPSAVPLVEETEHGSGYIRPKKEKKKKPKTIETKGSEDIPAPEETDGGGFREPVTEKVTDEDDTNTEPDQDDIPDIELPDDGPSEFMNDEGSVMEPPSPESIHPPMTDIPNEKDIIDEVPSWDEDEEAEDWDNISDDFDGIEEIQEFDDIEEMEELEDWEE